MKSRDPLPLSAVLSFLAAATATGFVATAGPQRSALVTAVAGLAAVGLGIRIGRHGHRLLGGVIGVGGGSAVLLAFARGWTGTVAHRFELYPALIGLSLLALGLSPVRRRWERRLVTAGTGGVLVTIVSSGVVRGAATESLLAATVATIVAWDLGEQAVNLSNHVGTDARTWSVEITHGAAGVVVGAIAIFGAMAATSVQVTDVPLAGLGVLLGATVVLTAALYN